MLAVVAVFVLVPAIAISAAFASTVTDTARTPQQQIAALKKQVRTLKAQVKDLNGQLSFVNGRIASLQQEATAIPQLAAIAAATGRYREVANAVADGYVRVDAPCLPTAGYHYVRGAWPTDNALDSLKPEFLMYAPSSAGLTLVAVEYAVPARFPRPMFLGGTFENYSAGPGEPIWYLHVWIWHLNPAGTFSTNNRIVEC